MKVRPLVLAACVAALALAAPGSAAPPKPQIVDAKGDAPSPGLDIVSGTFSTQGKTTSSKVRGRTVTTYTPTDLVVAIETAGPVTDQAGTTLRVKTQIEGCGLFTLTFSNTVRGDYHSGYVACLPDPTDPVGPKGDTIDVLPKIAGNTITWVIKFRTLGEKFGPGSRITKLEAYTNVADPVTGIFDTGLLDVALDHAEGLEYVVR